MAAFQNRLPRILTRGDTLDFLTIVSQMLIQIEMVLFS
jgi:hypothetical protein